MVPRSFLSLCESCTGSNDDDLHCVTCNNYWCFDCLMMWREKCATFNIYNESEMLHGETFTCIYCYIQELINVI